MTEKEKRRTETLLPGGKPRYVRVYDNGGSLTRFCRKCFKFHVDQASICPECGHRTVREQKNICADRYTVVFTGRYRKPPSDSVFYLAMDSRPTHPQGFGQHGTWNGFEDAPQGFPVALGGRHRLGRRIPFDALPAECQQMVLGDYKAIWNLK